MWVFLKDLLTSLVSTNDNNETIENTNDINFELNTSSECDYHDDDSNYLTIIDGDLNDDDKSQKHKLLKQKLLGNFPMKFPPKRSKKKCPKNQN